jgi:hypothetical protein
LKLFFEDLQISPVTDGSVHGLSHICISHVEFV